VSYNNKINDLGIQLTVIEILSLKGVILSIFKPNIEKLLNKFIKSFKPTNNLKKNLINLKLQEINSMGIWPMSENKKFIKSINQS
jgi:hypothetical protein